jgi:rhodanese-related sulfurtransferase
MASPWLLIGGLLVGLTAVLTVMFLWEYRPAAAMTPAGARAAWRHKEIDIIIDVRSEPEWRHGHFVNSTHIPMHDLQRELPRRVSEHDERILVLCATGRRASRAAASAQDLGYTRVSYMTGGDWQEFQKTPQPILNV